MSLQYLIDTDWVIHYLHAHPAIVARLDELQLQGLALSMISLAELYEGVYYSRDPEGDEQDLNNFLRGVSVLGLDEAMEIYAITRSFAISSRLETWKFLGRGCGKARWLCALTIMLGIRRDPKECYN